MAVRKTKLGFQVCWYDAEGRERKQTYRGITREEAKQIERERLAERDRGERPYDERNAPTFKAFAETWKEERRSAWKASTLAQYDQLLRSQLLPALGDLRVSQITESRVRQLVTQLQDAGLSARRSNLALLVLKMILGAARRRRFVRDDALAEVRMLKEPRTEVDPLAPDEIGAFLDACPVWWRPYFAVAFWTGIRPNEAAALKWGDVDWHGGRFRVHRGRYRGVESTPKTASSVRDVDMLPPVVNALRAQKAQQAAARLKLGQGAPVVGEDYVFTGPEGGFLNANALRDRVWYPTLTRARLLRRTAYQTRHSFASNALAAGEAPSWVAAMLGHKTAEQLFAVYARFIPNRTRRDGSALVARMTTASETPQAASAGSAAAV